MQQTRTGRRGTRSRRRRGTRRSLWKRAAAGWDELELELEPWVSLWSNHFGEESTPPLAWGLVVGKLRNQGAYFPIFICLSICVYFSTLGCLGLPNYVVLLGYGCPVNSRTRSFEDSVTAAALQPFLSRMVKGGESLSLVLRESQRWGRAGPERLMLP